MSKAVRMRVGSLSYLNALPFGYGLRLGSGVEGRQLAFDVPSRVGALLAAGAVEVALIPAGLLPRLEGVEVVTDFCIGATGPVRTVCLVSPSPIEEVRRIYLDGDSRTSVNLVRILTKEYWGIEPTWGWLELGRLDAGLSRGEAGLIIGDKVFARRGRYRYEYDLAESWLAYTGLPMVFAVWVAREGVEAEQLATLNADLEWGLSHIEEALAEGISPLPCPLEEAREYLTRSISYPLDGAKRRGLARYLQSCAALAALTPVGV